MFRVAALSSSILVFIISIYFNHIFTGQIWQFTGSILNFGVQNPNNFWICWWCYIFPIIRTSTTVGELPSECILVITYAKKKQICRSISSFLLGVSGHAFAQPWSCPCCRTSRMRRRKRDVDGELGSNLGVSKKVSHGTRKYFEHHPNFGRFSIEVTILRIPQSCRNFRRQHCWRCFMVLFGMINVKSVKSSS